MFSFCGVLTYYRKLAPLFLCDVCASVALAGDAGSGADCVGVALLVLEDVVRRLCCTDSQYYRNILLLEQMLNTSIYYC